MDLISTTHYGFERRSDGALNAHLVILPNAEVRRRLGTVFLTTPNRWGGNAPDGKFSTSGHKTREAVARALHRYHFVINPLA